MSGVARLLVGVYARLLRLYPRRFYATFGAEMRQVFAQALDEARREGFTSLAVLCWRELRDLPGSIVREHVIERKKEAAMVLWSSEDDRRLRGLRLLARGWGVLLCTVILVPVASPYPPHNPALTALLLVTHSVVIAWFREVLGGRLLIVSGLLLGAAAMLGAITGAGVPSVPVPGRDLLIVLWGGLVGLLFGAPVVALGGLFLKVGQRAEGRAAAGEA